MKLFLLLCLVYESVHAQYHTDATRQLPFYVTLTSHWSTTTYTGGVCGGTLISPNSVLTSGTCCLCGATVTDPTNSYFNAFIDLSGFAYPDPSVMADTCTESFKVTQWTCHPNWQQNNYCVMHLDRPSSYTPITLYDSSIIDINPRPDSTGTVLYSAGFLDVDALWVWNGVGPQPQAWFNTISKTTLTVLDTDACATYHLNNCSVRELDAQNLTAPAACRFNPSQELCARAVTQNGLDVFGDASGNPLFLKGDNNFVLVGILANYDFFYGGVYSRVDTPDFQSWIAPFIASTGLTGRRLLATPTMKKPTRSPTQKPTKKPTRSPTGRPTRRPSAQPTHKPTRMPTGKPTKKPTKAPTVKGQLPTPVPIVVTGPCIASQFP